MIGLPIGAVLTVKLQKLEGLWMGLSIAIFLSALLMSVWVLRLDCEKQADEARKRIALSEAVVNARGEDPLLSEA